MDYILNDAESKFVAACVLAWLSGYGLGVVYRTFRQAIEKATRS